MKLIETYDDQRLDLNDGTYLYLLQRNISIPDSGLTGEEFSRNVYRMTDSGETLWKIKMEWDYKGSPFTELYVTENPQLMYNSSGFRYLVDLETGTAETFEYPLLGQWKKRPPPSDYPVARFIEIQAEQRVYLDDGTYLFLAQRNIDGALTGLTPEDFSRNVFRMTEDGTVLWRVEADRDNFRSSFSRLFVEFDPRKIATWDGHKYIVDLETGEAEEYAYSP